MTHGHRTGDKKSPTYESWTGAKKRCSNPNYHGYFRYGGRGIKVCKRWSKFVNFLLDMGERPEGTSLDRIDPNGPYCKRNCKWSTPSEQRQNQRRMMRQ